MTDTALPSALQVFSRGGQAVFRAVYVDKTPLSVFLAVNLGFDAVRRYRRAVLAHCGVIIPVEL